MRIAPNEYSIDDLDAVKIIYGHGSKFVKVGRIYSLSARHGIHIHPMNLILIATLQSAWYKASAAPGEHTRINLFADTNAERHAENRRKVASLYSMTTLLRMESAVNDCVDVVKRRFDEFSNSKQTIDMHHWLQCYAFDVIGMVTVSKRFGFLEKGADIDRIMRSIHHYLHYCAIVGLYSEWHSLVFALVAALGFGGVKHIIMFAQAQIDKRLRQNEAQKETQGLEGDFLDKTLTLHRDSPERFSLGDVLAVCTSNIGAGSDTTGISLSSILYHLTRSPSSVEKLRREIEEGIANATVSKPITFQEAQKLPYLQAIIKEALRLHPATGLPLARVVPTGGAMIAGTIFPAGAVVGINTWVLHSDTSIFGPDVDDFLPERWLESDEKMSQMNKAWIPFGSGSRTCIGKNISLLEMSKLVPELMMHYDFELAGMDGGLETQNVWFVKQTNFRCKIKRRPAPADE